MINVRDSEEFSRLLEALSNDIVDAHVHFGLYQDLTAAFERFPLVWQQSRVFWSQTLQAHLDSCVQALCRVYDQRSDSLHLRSWLSTIKQNLHLFDDANFRERLKNNPHVASLATLAGPPDQSELDQDLRSVSTDDPAVKRLTVHRGSRIAHRSARNVIAQRDVNDAYPLTFDDVEILLERARVLLNQYAHRFAATVYSTKMVGRDDYEYIFESVQNRVEASRKEWEELAQKRGGGETDREGG